MTNQAHGSSLPNAGSGWTAKTGGKITCDTTGVTLTAINKKTGVTATTAYITDSGLSTLASASFSGDVATFSYAMTNGTTYYIVVDKGGSSYDGYVSNATMSYPVANSNISWIAGRASGGDDNDEIYQVLSIDISVAVNVTVTPSTLTLTSAVLAPTPKIIDFVVSDLSLTATVQTPVTFGIGKDVSPSTLSLGLALNLPQVSISVKSTITVGTGEATSRFLKHEWPITKGLTAGTQRQWGRTQNLVAVKTLVPKKDRVLL